MRLPQIQRPQKTTWRIKQKGSYYPIVKWIEKYPNQSISQFPDTEFLTDASGRINRSHRLRFQNIYKPLTAHRLPIVAIPEIEYPDHINYAKDLIYSEEGTLARKYKIERNCNIVSLAGGRSEQISLIYGQKAGHFDSYINVVQDYNNIIEDLVCIKNQILDTKISVTFGEILGSLKNTNRKYHIFDIDACCRLDVPFAIKLSNSIKAASQDTVMLGVTHTMRGSPSRHHVYTQQIPALIAALMYNFNIKDYVHNYYFNTTVMYRESFILEKKT